MLFFICIFIYIIVCTSLFIIYISYCIADVKPSYTPILRWDTAVHKLPWGVIVLLGGGFALADASSVSYIKVKNKSQWITKSYFYINRFFNGSFLPLFSLTQVIKITIMKHIKTDTYKLNTNTFANQFSRCFCFSLERHRAKFK